MEELDIVDRVRGKNIGGNCYYGVNVSSPSYEPIDQLDGFLIAKLVQSYEGALFFPFIAGEFEVLNSKTSREARGKSRRMRYLDKIKEELYENIMRNLELEGKVFITGDLWRDEEYWEIFREIISKMNPTEEGKCVPPGKSGMETNNFPKDILYKMERVVPPELFKDWNSASLYIPAEVAEAKWFKEKYGVGVKIGPTSERVFDDIIEKECGIGIVWLKQPEYVMVRFDGKTLTEQEVKLVPYIERKDGKRIFFSDTIVDIVFKLEKLGPSNPYLSHLLCLTEAYKKVDGRKRTPYVGLAGSVYDLVVLGRREA